MSRGKLKMKITLLGDSIRMQYAPRVAELLGEGYEIFAPAENCRFAKHTLRGLYDWRGDMKDSRIVHWNNGLWDMCDLFGDGCFADKGEYLKTMLRIADILLSKHEKVIFATTTPVTERNSYNKNSDIIEYNALLVPELMKRGVIVNDLHSPIYADVDRYVCSDNVHLSPEGIEICANLVARAITDAATTMGDANNVVAPDENEGKTGAPVII